MAEIGPKTIVKTDINDSNYFGRNKLILDKMTIDGWIDHYLSQFYWLKRCTSIPSSDMRYIVTLSRDIHEHKHKKWTGWPLNHFMSSSG